MRPSSIRRQSRSSPARAGQAAPMPAHGGMRWGNHLPWIALPAIAMLAYLPALRAGFLWDDQALTLSPLVKSPGGIWKIWAPFALGPLEQHYWPLVYSTFWLEHLIFGLKPAVFHFNNIMLHGLCAVLLWRVLRKLDVPGAWLGAALFAVHPVHVESVAWIIERKDVLSGALYLGAALAYLRFDCGLNAMRNVECGMRNEEIQNKIPPEGGTPILGPRPSPLAPHSAFRIPHSTFYALAVVLFAGALLSKSIVVTLPVALGLVIWWKRGRLGWRDLVPLLPLAVMAAAITVFDLRHMTHWKADGEAYASGLSLPERLLVASRAVWAYLGKLIWPHPLAPFYPKWDVNPARFAPWLPLLAGIGLLAGLWAARGRLGRGPLAAFAFYVLTLGPTLGLLDFKVLEYSWLADRFQYLASAGPLALAAAGLTRLAGRLAWPTDWKRTGAVILLGALALLTFHRASFYRDTRTLYSAAREDYPECAMAHYVYAVALLKDDASGLTEGHGEAILASLRQAMELQPTASTAVLLGQVQAEFQQYAAADAAFEAAVRLNPKIPSTYRFWGDILKKTGRLEEAVAQYQKALRLNPDEPAALGGLGGALREQQKFDEAAPYLARALELAPQDAIIRINYALVLANQKKPGEAVAQFEIVLRQQPGNIDAHNGLALVLHEQLGHPAEAAAHFETSLRLAPQQAAIHHRLGLIYEEMGKTQEAIRCYRAALSVQGDFAPAVERLRALGAR